MEATETKLMMMSKFTFLMGRKRVKKKIKNSLPREIGIWREKKAPGWWSHLRLIDFASSLTRGPIPSRDIALQRGNNFLVSIFACKNRRLDDVVNENSNSERIDKKTLNLFTLIRCHKVHWVIITNDVLISLWKYIVPK